MRSVALCGVAFCLQMCFPPSDFDCLFWVNDQMAPPLWQIYTIGVPLLYFLLLVMINPELRARKLPAREASERGAGRELKTSTTKSGRLPRLSRRKTVVATLASHVSQRLHLMEALHFLWEDYEVKQFLESSLRDATSESV